MRRLLRRLLSNSIEGSLSRLRDQGSRVGDMLRNIGGAIGVGLGLREPAEAADQ